MARYSTQILEEELKNKVAADWFERYDTTQIVGKIDFAVAIPVTDGPTLFDEPDFLLWAEAKRGVKQDIKASLVQLVLTIGKARTFDKHLPPSFLGAFDAEKIAFIPYNAVLDTFYQNDFNWNVTPSDHETKEFLELYRKIENLLTEQTLLFNYDEHAEELRAFIRNNFKMGKLSVSKTRITKNNFTAIYQKWRREVMPSIDANWENAKKAGIIDADFFLADILSTDDNASIKDKLFVLLSGDHYIFAREKDAFGFMNSKTAEFTDGGTAHGQFWLRYHRPPRRDYWDYIITRRDCLVPQDVRERKGSYFTPACWVELSQQYLADYLGEDWQDEYYIWDCCAGTGNLLAGLTNKYNIYASTLDKADVDVMRDRIQNGANLLESHVFQFDFLNDDLQGEKVPASLREILQDPEKRNKLVVYINPPYKEAATARQKSGTGANIKNVARGNKVAEKYATVIGPAINELFAQFLIKINSELPTTVLAEFSKLKILQAPNFRQFRQQFRAKLGRLFLVPANTFDNVKGLFPIGFHIWEMNGKDTFTAIDAEVFNSKGEFLSKKHIEAPDNKHLLMDWLKTQHDKIGERIAYLRMLGSDFQNNNGVFLTTTPSEADIVQRKTCNVTRANIISIAVYFASRLCIEATWLNDRDQFLFPNDSWKADHKFQSDCLVFTLFHGQNRISATGGTNHWIPFTEEEVGAKERFDSHFMSDFLKGKIKPEPVQPVQQDLFESYAKAHEDTASVGSPTMNCGVTDRNVLAAHHAPTDSVIVTSPHALTDSGKATTLSVTPHASVGTADNTSAGRAPWCTTLSPEAKAVMDAGRELWRYYHQQPNANPNASYYDIRRHFQGVKVTDKGKEMMNTESSDATYTQLITTLRQALKALAKKIEPKVYEHGFLKG